MAVGDLVGVGFSGRFEFEPVDDAVVLVVGEYVCDDNRRIGRARDSARRQRVRRFGRRRLVQLREELFECHTGYSVGRRVNPSMGTTLVVSCYNDG